MIARLWSAHAKEAQWQEYLHHFQTNVLSQLCELDGYAGSTLMTRKQGDEVEILVSTLWHSMEAVHQFAGPDCETAVVADEAAAILTSFDRKVRHFDVVLTDSKDNAKAT